MNSFVGQDGTIKFHYQTYGVDEVMPYSPQPRVRPNGIINLVAPGAVRPGQHRGNWGMNTGRFDWNARDDRLAESPLWRSLWLHPGNHVVVPISHAYEMVERDGTKHWSAICRVDQGPMWIPALGRIQKGAYRTEYHVSFVTVEAGPVFTPIHDKGREIVCLRDWDEATTWLAAKDEAKMRALLRPAEASLLRTYRVSDDVLKPSFPAEKCSEPYAGGP